VGRTRAKRLRGFGNGIVRPLAVAFVEATIDSFVEAVRASLTDAPEVVVVPVEGVPPVEDVRTESAA
jgi:hypothetical protein